MWLRIQRSWLPLASIIVLLLAADRLCAIPMRIGFDANEGWNGYQALHAAGGGPLYPPSGTMFGNNYPPLSFLLIGGLSRGFGDPIIIGRLVSLAAVMSIALMISLVLRRLNVMRPAPAVAAMLFLLLNATLLRNYLAMNDPQWLAQALMTGGVLLIIPRAPDAPPSTVALAGGASLLALALLTKHNLMAWPAAVVIWLVLNHRRSLIPFLAAASLAGTVTILSCVVMLHLGSDFLTNVTGASRTYSAARMIRHATVPLLVMVPMIAYCLPLLRSRANDRRIDFVFIAIGIAVPLGIVERSGAGVDFNAHFEAAVALCIGCGLAFSPGHPRKALAASFLLAIMVVGLATEARDLSGMRSRWQDWHAMQRHVAAVRGPVACEALAICFWAGKPMTIDFFLYGQRARLHGAAPELDRALAQRQLSAVQLDPDRPALVGDPLRARIKTAMRPMFTSGDGRSLLVPR